jgi:hypothetical protein
LTPPTRRSYTRPRRGDGCLTANFVDEILAGRENEGGFADAAWVQEVINAVERSHHERGWVGLPLEA